MILEVSVSHLKVKIGERVVTLPGKFVFLSNDKIGFGVCEEKIKLWDSPTNLELITGEEKKDVIETVRQDLAKEGYILIVE